MVDDLLDSAEAWYRQGGIELVNSLLTVEYPNPPDRVDALLEMEASGLWEVLWHRSSMETGDRPGYGLAIRFLGPEN